VLYKNKLPNNPNRLRRISFEKQIYAQLYADMDQISISTIFKRHLVLCRAITNNDYSKLREEQFPQKELNVAVALILGQKQDLSPDILQDYQYAVPYIFYLQDYMLDSCCCF
jgi:competence protein ComEC